MMKRTGRPRKTTRKTSSPGKRKSPGLPGLFSFAGSLRAEGLGLELVELRLRDRAGIEELLALGDLVRAGVGRGYGAHVVVHLRLLGLRPLRCPLAHAVPVDD